MASARRLALLLAALLMLVAACDGAEDGAADEDPDDGEEASEEEAPEQGEELDEEDLEDFDEEDLEELGLEQPEAPDPVDLPDGLAAVVDDDEISDETLEDRFEAVAAAPEVADQLEGEDAETLEEQLKAQILSRLILDRIVAIGADELGVDASEDEIAEREAEEAEAAGGEEAFAEQLESQGVTTEQLEEELRTIVLLDGIEEELTADLDEEDFEADEETAMSPADMAVQEWLFEQLTAREVEVDEDYGVWSAESGQVIPSSANG